MRDLLILVGVLALFFLCRFIWARRKKPTETFTVLGSLDPVPTKEAIEKRHQIESIDKLHVRVEKKEVEDEFQHAKSLLDSIQEAGRLRDVGEFTQFFGRGDIPSPPPPKTPAAPPSPSSPDATQVFAAPFQGPGEYTRMFAAPASPPRSEWAEIEVFFATDRAATGAESPNAFFSGNRNGGALTLGTCRVTIPRNHRLGALESPRLIKLEFAPNPQKHIVLLGVTLRSEQEFFENLSACVGSSERADALVFIHGYNVSFADAARRTAQISYDLGFHGAPILYSWPSMASVESYAVDEATIEWTVPHLKQFLKEVATRSGAQMVHVIAHSMGNRALARALHELSLENFAPPTRFQQIIMAAPDIDAATLRELATAIRCTAERVTLYTSAADKALIISRRFHRYPRAGEFVFPIDGIDVIDASAVDTSLVGHSYYGDNRSVLADLFWLISKGEPPETRFGMSRFVREDGTYFAFLP
jgi:esterase/lipase superfamily enzyme